MKNSAANCRLIEGFKANRGYLVTSQLYWSIISIRHSSFAKLRDFHPESPIVAQNKNDFHNAADSLLIDHLAAADEEMIDDLALDGLKG